MREVKNFARETLLGNWQRLNSELMKLKIDAVRELLLAEFKGAARTQVLMRLHARFNKLRAKEERIQLLGGKLPAGVQK